MSLMVLILLPEGPQAQGALCRHNIIPGSSPQLNLFNLQLLHSLDFDLWVDCSFQRCLNLWEFHRLLYFKHLPVVVGCALLLALPESSLLPRLLEHSLQVVADLFSLRIRHLGHHLSLLVSSFLLFLGQSHAFAQSFNL